MESNIMKSGYAILKDKELVIEVITGKVKLKKFKTDRDLLYCDSNYNPSFNMIIDTREAQMLLTVDDMIDYFSYLAGKSNVFNHARKTAILTSSELKNEYETGFKNFEKITPIHFYIFSDTEACAEWIPGNTMTKEELDEIILYLKENPHHQWFKGPNSIMGF
jgi:hypothetical protein